MKTTASSIQARRLIPFSLTLAAAVFMAGCGGDGAKDSADANDGGTKPTIPAPTPTPTPTPDGGKVAAAAAALVAEMGAKPLVGAEADTQVFDLTADIGDTWRLSLLANGSYRLEVLASQYGLVNSSGSYQRSENGHVVQLSSAAFTLQLDQRTLAIMGSFMLGGKRSGVAGSGYSAPAQTAALAGDYVYAGATRIISNGKSRFEGGNFRIAANGTDVTWCLNGLLDAAGMCSKDPTTASEQISLRLEKDSAGMMELKRAGGDRFALLNFQAGDRGPVLLLDRVDGGGPYPRTGSAYAVRQQALSGNESDGTWVCQEQGSAGGELLADGTSVRVSGDWGAVNETLHYNQLTDGSGLMNVKGFVTSFSAQDGPSAGVALLPLSSSLLVFERDMSSSVAVCHAKAK